MSMSQADFTMSTPDGPDCMPATDPVRPSIQWQDVILGGFVLVVALFVTVLAAIH